MGQYQPHQIHLQLGYFAEVCEREKESKIEIGKFQSYLAKKGRIPNV